MRRIVLLLPVLFMSLAVGFILYRGMGVTDELSAEEIIVTTGASGNAGDDQYSAGEAGTGAPGVPDEIVFTEPVDSVAFSHKKHAIDLGYDCKVCHTSLFQMDANSSQEHSDFNMDGLKAGKYCGSCHSTSGGPAFSSDDQCARCHLGVQGLDQEQ